MTVFLLNNLFDKTVSIHSAAAEWIETVLSNRLFSKKTVIEGQKLYKKYKKDLPPIFTAFTGGY